MKQLPILFASSLITLPTPTASSQSSISQEAIVRWDETESNVLNFFHKNTTVGAALGEHEIINLPNKNGIFDAGFVCALNDMTTLLHEDVHVIKIDPRITNIEGYGSIVHHMDLFACQQSVFDEIDEASHDDIPDWLWCANDVFLETSCKQLLWAYDRGAETFEFPLEAGLLLGPSSGFTTLLLQIHYLLPKGYVPDGKGLVDASGFRLTTEPAALRPYDVALFGFFDPGLTLPKDEEAYEYRAHLDSTLLAKVMGKTLKVYNAVYPIAVHLHGHDHLIRARLEHYDSNGELVGKYGEINPFHGYGHDQTFLKLDLESDDVQPLQEGDSLTFVCTFDTRGAGSDIRYGVSHEDEMCAPLIMYYPHVRVAEGNNVQNIASVYRNDYDDEREYQQKFEGQE
mmetsp:Transcript_17902/g.30890  ORF Transcript_17902/g.30890 Transcript_17902/m.30890 type:complete len:399 (-) Transcript_17902:290-1486(-)|eukprot:CAMPEP_0183707850 /NCGR_PEP_ID=MMETSP0737-20130205/4285_1 /TAXON_ID=385413 /ORGANISM="Thalassiosira miniscula, Strain CCMP1093" /LENGTH=398 /DNA_ID=CAMNT_0025935581 /DNA_START=243 /DNA_END=1439 /DNA_ORIENTATION=+